MRMSLKPGIWDLLPEQTERPHLWRDAVQCFAWHSPDRYVINDIVSKLTTTEFTNTPQVGIGKLGSALAGGGLYTYIINGVTTISRDAMSANGCTFAGVIETKATRPASFSNIQGIDTNGNAGLVRFIDLGGSGSTLSINTYNGSNVPVTGTVDYHDQQPHPYVAVYDYPNTQLTLYTDKEVVTLGTLSISASSTQRRCGVWDRLDPKGALNYLPFFANRVWSEAEALDFIADPFAMIRRSEDVPMHAFAIAAAAGFPVPLLVPRQNTLLRM